MKFENNLKKIKNIVFWSVILISIISCSSIKITNTNTINPENVFIIKGNDSLPTNSKFIKNLKIGYFPPYLSQYKNYDSLIVDAKKKTSEIGGNILQIISHTPYQLNSEKKELTFHKIKAKIFYSENPIKIQTKKKINSLENEIIINFYMLDQGPLVKKDIYLNDSIIIRNFGSMSKSKFQIKKAGTYVFKYGKNGIPLKLELKENQIYYLKCYIKLGVLRNKSVIEEVSNFTEYESY